MERSPTTDDGISADDSVRVSDVVTRTDDDGDSGQVETLADGSVSIPVFEERLFVEKRLVVRERIIVRKYTVTEDRVVEGDIRREHVEVEADEAVVDRVDDRR